MIVRFDVYVFDRDRRRVTAGGAEVHLTPKAFDLLGLLIEEAPRVVTKATLHQRLWPDTFVSDATLVGLVKELRRMLPARESDAVTIRTSHGVGYAFDGRLHAAVASTQQVTRWIVADGRHVPLQRGVTLIGRDPSAGVFLDLPGVSRRHARIVVDDVGAAIEDLGSKNGTTVRGMRLDTSTALMDGDQIGVGTTVLVYRESTVGMSTESVELPGAPLKR